MSLSEIDIIPADVVRVHQANFLDEQQIIHDKIQEEKRLRKEQLHNDYVRKGKKFAEIYNDFMKQKILDGINVLSESSKQYVKLNITNKAQFYVGDTSLDFHVVHYGGKPSFEGGKPSWKKRIPNELFQGLFKENQKLLLSKGYYLLDVSDSSKSFAIIIKLCLGKPSGYDDELPLWHGLNKI